MWFVGASEDEEARVGKSIADSDYKKRSNTC